MASDMQIKISENGPYLVSGNVPLEEQQLVFGEEGNSYETTRRFPPMQTYALCRCGHSSRMPFCDGTHLQIGFDGRETASREPFDQRAILVDGPGLTLKDDRPLCALIRFCHQAHGDAWSLTEESDNPDAKAEAILGAQQCASGRLVAIDKQTGKVLEPDLEPSIALLQDPERGCSGPIYVKGGIPLESADGHIYESRNRVTLCRCGESQNKPFCDTSHLLGFKAKIPPDEE